MMNGPAPAEFWFNHDSAASSGPVVPPWAITVLLSSGAKAGKLPLAMKAGSGPDLVTTTVIGSGVSMLVIPSKRNDGLPLMPITRSQDHFTSADVSGLPEVWNLMP